MWIARGLVLHSNESCGRYTVYEQELRKTIEFWGKFACIGV